MTIDAWLQAAIATPRSAACPRSNRCSKRSRNRRRRSAPPISTTMPRSGAALTRPTEPTPTVTIAEFGRRLRAHELTSEQVTEECLRRIDADNPRLNAFILVMADEARTQAREADRELAAGHDRGPLHGVPISLKDLLDARGTPTTAASRVRDGHVAERDAPVDRRTCARPGAVFVGKTNLHEFAFGTTNEDSAFGPARNPHDPQRSPGGSSGGSAVERRRRHGAGDHRHRHRRVDPHPRRRLRHRRPEAGASAKCRPTASSRCRERSITSGRSTQTVTDAWLVYRALLGDAMREAAGAGADAAACVSPCRARYFCDVLDDEVRARFEESAGGAAARRARRSTTSRFATRATSPRSTCTSSIADAAAYHAATLETMPERYTPNRAAASRDGALRAGRGLRAGARRTRACCGAKSTRRCRSTTRSRCRRCRFRRRCSARRRSASAPRTEPVRNMMLRLTCPFNVTGIRRSRCPRHDSPAAVLDAAGRRPRQTDALLACAGFELRRASHARLSRVADAARRQAVSRSHASPVDRAQIAGIAVPRSGRFGAERPAAPRGGGMSGGGTGLMSGGGVIDRDPTGRGKSTAAAVRSCRSASQQRCPARCRARPAIRRPARPRASARAHCCARRRPAASR